MKQKIHIFLVCTIFVLFLTACGLVEDIDTDDKVYTLGETFIFDNLEITLSSDYTFVKMQNPFDEYHGKNIFRIPITVKNLDEEINALNMFYYDVYGPNGTQIDIFNFYSDDNIGSAGSLLKDGSYTKYMYFVYEGNGDYQFIFDNWSSKIKVKFSVSNGPDIDEVKTEYTLNEKFEYDGLDIIATGYSFTVLENQYSEHYQKPVVRIEFTVKNLMDKANNLSFLDIKTFDPLGKEADDLDVYFEDSIWTAEDLNKDSEGIVAIYFVYTSDGEYKINFGLFATYLTLKVNIQKQ